MKAMCKVDIKENFVVGNPMFCTHFPLSFRNVYSVSELRFSIEVASVCYLHQFLSIGYCIIKA